MWITKPIGYFLAVYLSIPGLAWGGGQEKISPADPELEPVLAGGQVLFLQSGDLFALGDADSGPIPVRRRGEKHSVIVSPTAAAGQRLTAAWIEKGAGVNDLYVVSAGADDTFPLDPKPLATGTSSTFARLIAAGDGGIYLLDGASHGKPALFLGRSEDGGHSFQRSPLELDGFKVLHRVSATAIGSHLHIFVHGVHEGRSVIALVDYDAVSRQAMPAEIVAEVPSTPLMQALALQGEPAVVYKAYRDGKYSLNLARRQVQNWNSSAITDASGMDVARLDHHVWPDGRLLIVFSGELQHRSKQRVFAALSEGGVDGWHMTRLDRAEFGNTRAWLPRLAVDAEQVAVVWEDARDIRSRIRLQLSADRGATWLAHDVPLSHGPHYAMRPRIYADGAELQIAWMQYRSDAKEELDVMLRTLGWDEALALAKREAHRIGPNQKEQRLRQTVTAYWQAMTENDRQAAYLAHDPFFRARIPFMQYAARRGPIVYHDYEIGDIAIRGNEAAVGVEVNYSVPKLKAMGKELSIPARTYPVQDTWLFIDGTWHRKFVDPMSGGSAIVY